MAAFLSSIAGIFSLHSNATYGRLSLVQSCLLLGRADVNGKYTELQTTPLHAAAYNGHLPVVKYLYEVWQANPLVLSADGWTSLHCAAMNGYLPVVKYLIEDAHVRTTIESNEGWTCLHAAAANGFLPVVKYLIEKQGMDVEFTTYNGWTPLHWACCNGYLTVAKYLLSPLAAQDGASVASSVIAPASDGSSDSSGIIHAPVNPSISSFLPTPPSFPGNSSRANPSTKTGCGSTVLHLAARQGHRHVVEWLLSEAEDGAKLPLSLLRATNDSGLDAFTLACLKGKLPCVELIVSRLGKESFPQESIQKAHDLHTLAAQRGKLPVNAALLKYLRSWMQEVEYHDHISDESVEVLTIREVIRASDSSRSAAGDGGVPHTIHDYDDGAHEEEDDEGEDDDDDASDHEDEAADASTRSITSTLDNAHLSRSDPSTMGVGVQDTTDSRASSTNHQ